jgi:hypothetical protein
LIGLDISTRKVTTFPRKGRPRGNKTGQKQTKKAVSAFFLKFSSKKFAQSKKAPYLCTRKTETTPMQKLSTENLVR